MIPLDAARAWLAARTPRLQTETVSASAAPGRVLGRDVALPAMPGAPTAAIAGWAVLAAATEGAGEYAPMPIEAAPVEPGDAMPPGTDAVLPPSAFDHGHALAMVPRGSGVLPAGHDVPTGCTLPAGTLLRPLHAALLSQQPHATIEVIRRPGIAIDCASAPMLEALAREAGATPNGTDLCLCTRLDTVFAPAIAIRPGTAASIGTQRGIPALCFQGHPLDHATLFAILVAPALRRMGGRPDPLPQQARLARKITSELGMLDAIRVRLDNGNASPLGPAEHCGLVAGLEADALVLVPEASEGYPQAALVPILPL